MSPLGASGTHNRHYTLPWWDRTEPINPGQLATMLATTWSNIISVWLVVMRPIKVRLYSTRITKVSSNLYCNKYLQHMHQASRSLETLHFRPVSTRIQLCIIGCEGYKPFTLYLYESVMGITHRESNGPRVGLTFSGKWSLNKKIWSIKRTYFAENYNLMPVSMLRRLPPSRTAADRLTDRQTDRQTNRLL